jgi:hypothetical protein
VGFSPPKRSESDPAVTVGWALAHRKGLNIKTQAMLKKKNSFSGKGKWTGKLLRVFRDICDYPRIYMNDDILL